MLSASGDAAITYPFLLVRYVRCRNVRGNEDHRQGQDATKMMYVPFVMETSPSPQPRTSASPTENSPLAKPSTPSSCPLAAAAAHRSLVSDRRSRECMCFTVLKYPFFPASSSLGIITVRPVAATASRIPRETAETRARSVGSDNLSRTCATTRWPERPGIGAPENESGATGLLAGVSGLEVIVGGRACARAGRCGGFDVGALGRDDLNRREVERRIDMNRSAAGESEIRIRKPEETGGNVSSIHHHSFIVTRRRRTRCSTSAAVRRFPPNDPLDPRLWPPSSFSFRRNDAPPP